MAIQYLSDAWGEEARKVMATDPVVQRALGGLDLSLLVIILDVPAGANGFIYAAFEGGELVDEAIGTDYDAITRGRPKPTFVSSGSYDTFVAMQEGRLSERRALLKGELHLTGSMFKALRHMKALETLTAALRRIDCQWATPSPEM
ncbi:MAG: hypothetical protein ACPGQL_06260 [Thermoplasmatota archaeon]